MSLFLPLWKIFINDDFSGKYLLLSTLFCMCVCVCMRVCMRIALGTDPSTHHFDGGF